MEPTLPDGFSTLVDHWRRRLRDDAIFVVLTSEGPVVKRASGSERGGWRLISDNPESDSLNYRADFSVIGKVKWVGKSL